jgi:hypothetical protein
MDVHVPGWLVWVIWTGFLGALLFGLAAIGWWHDRRYERRARRESIVRRLHVHDFVIVGEILGEPSYKRCICGAKPPRERPAND